MTRGVAPPVVADGGHYIAVGQPDQKARYVFPSLEAERLSGLAARISERFVYLKICEPPEAVRAVLPDHWVIRYPATYMMTGRLHAADLIPPPGYRVDLETVGFTRTATVHHGDQQVARGRIVLLEDTALFDQVSTDEAHRRRGLGRLLMQALANDARDQSARHGLLCATQMGRPLYESLGWTVHAPYTSAVIAD